MSEEIGEGVGRIVKFSSRSAVMATVLECKLNTLIIEKVIIGTGTMFPLGPWNLAQRHLGVATVQKALEYKFQLENVYIKNCVSPWSSY